MTVNYSFDLENDDFLDDTFRSIPEKDLLSYSISSPASENLISNNFGAPSPSNVFEGSSINTHKNKKYSLYSSFKSREGVLDRQKDLNFSKSSNSNKSVNSYESTKINSRFVPGVTPKVKKRKLPGPAGFCFGNEEQNFQPVDSENIITKGTTVDMEIQNITNSQFSSEDLLLPSWQNLQAEVSSCHNLLSTVKYYSIHRVLYETSKKKLPKHLVVPVLCVLIKKFNSEESSLVFMDDTGEISGKIDKEVLDVYKDVIEERTALILKRVTCICNILILKKQNVVSIYLENGSVKHVQDLNSILDKEPLKPMNCQCPGTPDEQTIKKLSFSKVDNSTPVTMKKTFSASHKASKKLVSSLCSNANSLNKGSYNVNNTSPCPQVPIEKEKVLNILEAMLDVSRNDRFCDNMSASSAIQTVGETLKSVTKVGFNSPASCSNEVKTCNLTSKILNTGKSSNNSKSRLKDDTVNNPSLTGSTLEDLFCEDEDDFDNIMCSLDEKSFLQEM